MLELFAQRGPDAYALLLRALLHTGLATALPQIARNTLGKPYFPARPELHFSLSHSGPYLLCSLSDTPVGADIELLRHRRENLPRYALTEEEFAQYLANGGDWPAFYALWTRKEAYLKYSGEGLAKGLRRTPVQAGLCYGSYQGADYCAALCCEQAAPAALHWLAPDAETPKEVADHGPTD